MELPDKEMLALWLTEYGSFALFGLLAVGIIALPVPEETMMMVAGYLISADHLKILPTFVAAYLGSICGITVSYLIGRTAGKYFIEKFGIWIGLTPARLQKGHEWFERYGKWTLFFGYFIPGVRHFTGVTAGMAGLEYHNFALFAYTGAIVWATTFLSIGYFFGDYWSKYFEEIEITNEEIILLVVMALVAIILVKILNSTKVNSKNDK